MNYEPRPAADGSFDGLEPKQNRGENQHLLATMNLKVEWGRCHRQQVLYLVENRDKLG